MDPSKPKLYAERMAHLAERAYARLLPAERRDQFESKKREEAFSRIYREERWGNAAASGGGSTLDYTEPVRTTLQHVIENFGIRSMLDVACGDFGWMPMVLDSLPESFRYVGSDIVPELIAAHTAAHPRHEFHAIDFVRGELPQCDLILCRDALQHLAVDDIKRALENFSSSGARFLLATTHLRRFGWRNRRNKRTGQCLDRNLLLPPFSLPDPIVIFSERDAGHKFLGLWSLPFQS